MRISRCCSTIVVAVGVAILGMWQGCCGGERDAEAAKAARDLVEWFGRTYADKPYDVGLIARVATFEQDLGRQHAFVVLLEAAKNNDKFSRDTGALAGFFFTNEVLPLLASKLITADNEMRASILLALYRHRTVWLIDKNLLLEVFRTSNSKVKSISLITTMRLWGKEGAQIYAAGFADPDSQVVDEAFMKARITGAFVTPQAKQVLRNYLGTAPREKLNHSWIDLDTSILVCTVYLEEAYGLARPTPEKDRTARDYLEGLLRVTDRIDAIRADYTP